MLLPNLSQAGSLTYNSNTYNAGDGADSASATFTPFSGLKIGSNTYSGIEITLTNLLTSAPGGEGLAISGIKFNIANSSLASGLGALLQDQGQEISFTSSKGVSTGTPGSVVTGTPKSFYHWGSGTTSGTTYLETVNGGGFASGGQPNHLIVPQTSGNTYQSSSYASHTPGFLKNASFWIVDTAVTSSTSFSATDFSGVQIQFGTAGNAYDATTLAATPEPGTLTLLGIGIVGLAGYGWLRRKAC